MNARLEFDVTLYHMNARLEFDVTSQVLDSQEKICLGLPGLYKVMQLVIECNNLMQTCKNLY